MSPDEAKQIVAESIAHWALYAISDEWDSYPDIGEDDWLHICSIIDSFHHRSDRFSEAYDLLAARADHEC